MFSLNSIYKFRRIEKIFTVLSLLLPLSIAFLGIFNNNYVYISFLGVLISPITLLIAIKYSHKKEDSLKDINILENNLSKDLIESFAKINNLNFLIQNKEEITKKYGSKEWIFHYYFRNDNIQNRLKILSDQNFINFVKDIEDEIKLKYFNDVIELIEKEKMENLYKSINDIFPVSNNIIVNAIKYKYLYDYKIILKDTKIISL